MRRVTPIALVLTVALFAACGNEQTQTTAKETAAAQQPAVTSANLTPEELGELGAQIRKEPARADEILARRGMNQQSFEKAIREVTENPDASKRYAESYRKASA